MLRPNKLIEEEENNKEKALELLAKVDMDHKRNAMGGDLSHGQRRLLEITRALALNPRLLLLDEPMSGLHPQMIDNIERVIAGLRDDGITIWFIEHNMEVVLELAERVIVLDHGHKLAEGTPEEIRSNAEVNTAYLGRSRTGAA